MKRLRFVARVAAVMAALVAVLVLAVAVLFNSESFSRWLLAAVAERSDGSVQIGSVSGTFGGGLSVGSVAVKLDSGSAVATTITLELDWRSLIARSLVVESLHIERLDVVAREGGSSSSDIEPLEFALLVLIRELVLDELNVSINDSNYVIRNTALELRLLRNRLELNAVDSAWEQLAFNGRAAFTLNESLLIDGTICIDGMIAGERAAGCVDADGNAELLELDTQFRLPFTFAGNGAVALAENGAVEFNVSWQNASLAAVADATSPEGSLRLSGTTSRPRLDAAGSVTYAEQPAEFVASAVIAPQGINVGTLRLVQGAATAELSGEIASALDAGEFVLELQNIDPQRWISDWPGTLDATAEVAVTVRPALEVAVSDIVARGELRGYPVAAVGALNYDDGSLAIDALQIVSRSDQIAVTGRVADELDVDVQATIGNLGIVADGLSGALSAELRVTGSPRYPSIRGAIDVTEFSTDELAAKTLHITGNAGLEADDPLELAVFAADASVSGTSLGSVSINVTGTASAHRLDAQLTADTWSSHLVSTGAIADRDWSGRISELEFVPGELGFWRLRLPAEFSYGESGYSVSELCLTYALSSLCGAISVSGSSEDAVELSAVNFDVSILEPFMPSSLRAKGLINASGALAGFTSEPRGEIRFEAADAQVDLQLAPGVALPIPIAEFELAALLDDAGATVSARIDAAESGNAAAAFVVAEPLDEDSPVRGSLNVEWENAAALSLLSPDVDAVQGRVNANLSVGGTLSAPALNGSANWFEGALEVPAWGLIIDQIRASIEASESREAVFSATGLVDSTPVEISGTVLLDAEQGWPMRLEVRGDDLSLVQLADVEMRVSPNLEADVRLPRINVSGSVAIPYARFRGLVLPEQAVVPSPDTVVHGQELAARGRPLDVVADLVLELGDDVTYEDANLNAAVTGRLDLDYRSGEGAAAQGALSLSGEYDAYGNPLALERGQLIFVGPMNDPSLDILAVREIGEVTAGVQLTGTLRSPITTVFSDPSMSEANALSWLLFGRPLDGAREADSSALRNAALAMGLQQALPVIERIGESLRLDDFAIRNTETDAGALMAGKYLSPNLYFRYSYGLFNRIGGLLLRYRINDRYSLETRSGEHNSMDLLYTVEKD